MEEEDPDYMEVLHKVWRSLVDKKLYITGGCGALYNGASPYGYFFDHQLVHQAYGYEYQLPNITAYNETCASLGGVFWAYHVPAGAKGRVLRHSGTNDAEYHAKPHWSGCRDFL